MSLKRKRKRKEDSLYYSDIKIKNKVLLEILKRKQVVKTEHNNKFKLIY